MLYEHTFSVIRSQLITRIAIYSFQSGRPSTRSQDNFYPSSKWKRKNLPIMSFHQDSDPHIQSALSWQTQTQIRLQNPKIHAWSLSARALFTAWTLVHPKSFQDNSGSLRWLQVCVCVCTGLMLCKHFNKNVCVLLTHMTAFFKARTIIHINMIYIFAYFIEVVSQINLCFACRYYIRSKMTIFQHSGFSIAGLLNFDFFKKRLHTSKWSRA